MAAPEAVDQAVAEPEALDQAQAAPGAVDRAQAAPLAADQAGAVPGAVDQALASEVLRGRSMLVGFTGLIPLALMVPILMLHLYAFGIIEGLVAGVAVISYHQARRQGITSLELVGVSFATLTAVLYFGFGNETLIKNLDIVIFTLLAALTMLSLIRRQPWTAQFARRAIPPEMWDRPAFHIINMRLTALWAAAFVVCDLIASLESGPVRRFVPVAILFMTAAVVPRLARWYRERLVAEGVEQPAA